MNAPITQFERERYEDEQQRARREAWVNKLTDAQYQRAQEAVAEFSGHSNGH